MVAQNCHTVNFLENVDNLKIRNQNHYKKLNLKLNEI